MKTIKILTVLTAAAIVACGSTREIAATETPAPTLARDRIPAFIERGPARRLRLDREQQLKLCQILAETHGQLKSLRNEYRPQLMTIVSNAKEQVTAMLTPEQQLRFEQWKESNHPLLQAIRQDS